MVPAVIWNSVACWCATVDWREKSDVVCGMIGEPGLQNHFTGAMGTHLIAKTGLTRKQARTGAVTLIQRCGDALNLNVHFHMLVLDGVYCLRRYGRPGFVPIPASTLSELTQLVERISQRVGRHLERRGLIVRDNENAWLDWDDQQASLQDDLAGHSITYRIAVGPHRGQKAFTLQTLPPWAHEDDEPGELATAAGFSLHAGIAARAHQQENLERLCRYVTRPAVAHSRLSLTDQGLVRYSLKTPWRDGTTHVLLEPLDFIPQGTFSIAARSHLVARLAALIPRPGVNLTRYHGVFAPNSHWRAWITPARRDKRRPTDQHLTAPEKHRAMTWAQRLKRVFRIDVETCEHCGGAVKILACIRVRGWTR